MLINIVYKCFYYTSQISSKNAYDIYGNTLEKNHYKFIFTKFNI